MSIILLIVTIGLIEHNFNSIQVIKDFKLIFTVIEMREKCETGIREEV